MNRQVRQDCLDETPGNWLVLTMSLALLVLGALDVLGGSKKNFAVLLAD